MIYVVVLGREAIFLFLHGSSKQGKINVTIGRFELIDRENKKDAGYKKLNFGKANDFGLIKNHAILKKYDICKHLGYVDFVSFIRQS